MKKKDGEGGERGVEEEDWYRIKAREGRSTTKGAILKMFMQLYGSGFKEKENK